MIIKINEKFYARIYFGQIQGSLLLNGRLIEPKSTKIKVLINFLDSLSISINILPNKLNQKRKQKNKINKITINNKLLLKISFIIKKIIKKKKFKNNNEYNNRDNYLKNIFTFNIKSYLFIILIFLFFVLIFIYDYKSIEAKINQSNYFEIKKIESDYNINKCDINGDLPSLKQKCELMLDQIELLKTKKPSLISVFFIWLMDILNSYFTTFNFINCVITIIFLIIIYKLLK